MKNAHPMHCSPVAPAPGYFADIIPASDRLSVVTDPQQVAFYDINTAEPVKRSHVSMFMAYKAFLKQGAARNWQIVLVNPYYNYI